MTPKQVKEPLNPNRSLQDSNLPRAMRSPVVAKAVLTLQSGVQVNASTTDISIAGCYVTTTIQLQRGTAVRVQIVYRNKTFSTMGQVARSIRNKGTGIKFRNVEPSQLAVLQEWLFSQSRAVQLPD